MKWFGDFFNSKEVEIQIPVLTKEQELIKQIPVLTEEQEQEIIDNIGIDRIKTIIDDCSSGLMDLGGTLSMSPMVVIGNPFLFAYIKFEGPILNKDEIGQELIGSISQIESQDIKFRYIKVSVSDVDGPLRIFYSQCKPIQRDRKINEIIS